MTLIKLAGGSVIEHDKKRIIGHYELRNGKRIDLPLLPSAKMVRTDNGGWKFDSGYRSGREFLPPYPRTY